MEKGSFLTETFNPAKSTIVMNDWVEPTIWNTGETTVYLNGIAIRPRENFVLGATGVKMNGTYKLMFPEGPQKSEVKVNYVLLINTCP